MTWTQGTALVSTLAELKSLTSFTDLANLESDSELTIATDTLVSASDQLFIHLKSKGIAPGDLTNTDDFKHAVAWHAIALLVIAGHLQAPEGRESPVHPFEWSKPHLDQVRPELAEDSPIQVGQPRPKVRNVNPGFF